MNTQDIVITSTEIKDKGLKDSHTHSMFMKLFTEILNSKAKFKPFRLLDIKFSSATNKYYVRIEEGPEIKKG